MVKSFFCSERERRLEVRRQVFFLFFRESLLLLCLLERLLRHAGQPIDAQGSENVEDNVHPNQAKVPPSLRVVAANASQISVGLRDRAVDTLSRRVRVEEIASSGVDKCGEVLATGFA